MEKKLYELRFRYTDNDQTYEDCLLLSDSARDELKQALTLLLNDGYIETVSRMDPDEVDYVLTEWADPTFLTFDEMKSWWEGGSLTDRLEDLGFMWRQESETS